MIEIIIGAASGCAIGIGMGLLIAVTTRDGIWPNLWALLMIGSTAVGAALGLIGWALT